MNKAKSGSNSTYERLRAYGFEPEQPWAPRARVSTSERGKRYVLTTTGSEPSAVYAVDGHVLKEGPRCDKLVLVRRDDAASESGRWTEIFVELKGVDTSHAIDQLRHTLRHPIFSQASGNDVRARIVAQSFPSNKSNPSMEKAKREFRRLYHCDLRGMKSGQEDRL